MSRKRKNERSTLATQALLKFRNLEMYIKRVKIQGKHKIEAHVINKVRMLLSS